MPLVPKHSYCALIYAEILSAIGSRLVELVGPKAALGVFSRDAQPVGMRDGRRLMHILGVSEGNAASAAVLSYSAGRILGLDVNVVSLDTGFSQLRAGKCIYGDAVLRYKHPIVCALCSEYNSGLAAAAGVRFRQGEQLISRGCDFCIANFEDPKVMCARLPNVAFTGFMVRVVGLLSDRASLLVSTLSSLFIGIGERASCILGPDAALIPARAAFDAGKYQGPIFSGILGVSGGLAGASSLLVSVREVLGCSVGVVFSGGGFSLVTRQCPQRSSCSKGGFIEVACASYSRGLLSRFGDFEVASDVVDGVCRQEFRLRIPVADAGPKA